MGREREGEGLSGAMMGGETHSRRSDAGFRNSRRVSEAQRFTTNIQPSWLSPQRHPDGSYGGFAFTDCKIILSANKKGGNLLATAFTAQY